MTRLARRQRRAAHRHLPALEGAGQRRLQQAAKDDLLEHRPEREHRQVARRIRASPSDSRRRPRRRRPAAAASAQRPPEPACPGRGRCRSRSRACRGFGEIAAHVGRRMPGPTLREASPSTSAAWCARAAADQVGAKSRSTLVRRLAATSWREARAGAPDWRACRRAGRRGIGLADCPPADESSSARFIRKPLGRCPHETSLRAQSRRCRPGRVGSRQPARLRRRHHQGRRAALALRNDGDLRDGAQGHRADDRRRDQREGRRARQEARGRWSSIRRPTGRCSPRRPSSC